MSGRNPPGWLIKLTNDPQKSWQRFTSGLVIFIVGLVIMVAGVKYHNAAYYIGLIILLPGFVYAMTGYLAMLINRLRIKR